MALKKLTTGAPNSEITINTETITRVESLGSKIRIWFIDGSNVTITDTYANVTTALGAS